MAMGNRKDKHNGNDKNNLLFVDSLDTAYFSLPYYQINLSLQYEKISQRRVRS